MLTGNKFNILSLLFGVDFNLKFLISFFAQIVDPVVQFEFIKSF